VIYVDMCFSVHFCIVLSDTPINAQMILLYKNWPTCFDPKGLSSGLYMIRIPVIACKSIEYLLVYTYAVSASVKMYV
jgi:hypothetical protein